MAHAYVLGQVTVKDEALWAQYRSQVPATLAPWGAELVFRGTRAAMLAGACSHPDVVLIRFPTLDAANGWFTSPGYQALIALREQAADVTLQTYTMS